MTVRRGRLTVLLVGVLALGGSQVADPGHPVAGDALDLDGGAGTALELPPVRVGDRLTMQLLTLPVRDGRTVRVVDLRPDTDGCEVEPRGGQLFDRTGVGGIVGFVGERPDVEPERWVPLPLDAVALTSANTDRFDVMLAVRASEPGRCEVTGVRVVYEEDGRLFVQTVPSAMVFTAS